MTVTEILKVVRDRVNDAGDGPQTWVDAKYVTCINEGMRLIFDKFAESRVAATGQSLSVWADASANTSDATLCVDEVYKSALIEYVLYRYYGTDGGDVLDASRSAVYLKRFKEILSPGA